MEKKLTMKLPIRLVAFLLSWLIMGNVLSQVQFVYTSDAHYGIARARFQQSANVTANIVNAAMIAKMNTLSTLKLPNDGGINSGKTIGGIDFVVMTGDIANRQEIPLQCATASWYQFKADYDKISLKNNAGQLAKLYLLPGNHDVTNAVGFYKPMIHATDSASMVNIYNLMMPNNRPAGKYYYANEKIHYSKDFGGIHFIFVCMWPDSAERVWIENDLANVSATTPVFILTHDQPAVESKHFTNPYGAKTINATDKFENLLLEVFKDGKKTSSASTIEQRAFAAFIKKHPNIVVYFHGNDNQNNYYVYTGPDKNIVLNTIQVDSPMKGNISSIDETKLSFQLVSIDTITQVLTVRECLWNTDTVNINTPIVFGASKTIPLNVAQINYAHSAGYSIGDFHQHTTFSDGSYSVDYMMSKNNQFRLDWWANSEHGGGFATNGLASGKDLSKIVYWDSYTPNPIIGSLSMSGTHQNMWRWQSLRDSSFAGIIKNRALYPSKLIIQSYEMNVPGHEHASMGLIANQFDYNPNVNPLAQFEFTFDASDADVIGGTAQGWSKSTNSNNHAKTLEALSWLQTNYPTQSYLVPAHPERQRKYNISHFRDMNSAAPSVCFGFESMPGHQKDAGRGGYSKSAFGNGTFGGTGYFSAKIGGLWDAMLSEGRAWWLFANSDCHDVNGDFFPGEYQKNYTYTTDRTNPQAVIDGLRSGNTWVVEGDLIDSLIFTASSVSNPSKIAEMGQSIVLNDNTLNLSIKVKDPQGSNNNTYSSYNNPELNHIDIIAGAVTGIIPSTDPRYNIDTVGTTSVIARFGATAGITDSKGIVSQTWTDLGNGWKEMNLILNNVNSNMYFRLRGSNLGLNVANETDSAGNPLPDSLVGANNAVKAFADLWFYSNPIFVSSNAILNYAINLDSSLYTVPSVTQLKRAIVTAKNNGNIKTYSELQTAINNLVPKSTPYNVVTTINGNPATNMGFAWFTNIGINGGQVKIVSGNTTDTTAFASALFTVNAKSDSVKNLNYNVAANGLLSLAGIANNSKRSYMSNKALVTGLEPNTSYSYIVGKPGAWSKVGSFTTAKANNDAFSFIYFTDPQANTNEMFDISQKTTHAAIVKYPNINFVLSCGDLVETSGTNNSEWEYEQFFSTQQDLWYNKPFAPVVGNHDKTGNKNFTNHFSTAISNFDRNMSTVPGSVYSFVYGNALFMALSYEDYSVPGYLDSLANWMTREVAAHPEVKWRVAFYHKTMYTGSGSHQSDADGKIVREKMGPVFDRLKIDLALQGHDHIYEVLGPIKGNKLVANTVSDQTIVPKTVRDNVTGKLGGTFDVTDGTLYFLNNSAGKKKYEPRDSVAMSIVETALNVPNYFGMFTGRFGQTGEPTFSNISVSTDSINISTYTVNDAGTASLFDAFKIVKTIHVDSIVLSAKSLSLLSGSTANITASVMPINCSNKNIVWSSSDSSVVNVVNGTITALKVGTVTITAKSLDKAKTAACIVTVLPDEKVFCEKWINIKGGSVSNIPVTTTPDSIFELTSIEIPINTGDKYGVIIRGYIIPSDSSDFKFFIASDNDGEFWLSTNEKPENKVKQAYVIGKTLPHEWTKFSTQKSGYINLEAGKQYYFEALMKESSGLDHLSIGWMCPNTSEISIIGSKNISSYYAETIPASKSAITEGTLSNLQNEKTTPNAIAYPNPLTGNILHVNVSDFSNEKIDVTIIDANGKLVKQTTIYGNNSDHSIDCSSLQQGIYVLKLASINESQTIKFVKE
jgi:hypothetical protein